jgi:hypothetical protein
MAAPFLWSNAELARVYAAAYQGREARLCLANNTGSLTANSTTAQWDAAEITSQAANGYARYTWTLPAATYKNTTLRIETALETAAFQAASSGSGLNYDSVYLVLGTGSTWDTHIAGLFVESPTIALAPGQPRAYKIKLICDDNTTV